MNNKPAAHTPTLPWSIIDNDEYDQVIVVGADGIQAFQVSKFDDTRAIAALIVLAVNAREELVIGMRTLVSSLESLLANTKSHKEAFGGSRYSIIRMIQNDIAIAKERIAKAEDR